MHGDYRFDNVIFAPHDPGRIAAVVDWEMSTVGDPLCDLGLLIVYWVDDPDDPATGVHPGARGNLGAGFLTRDGLITAYAAKSGRDLAALEWYIALGHYKLAIIAEGIHARFLMGMTVGEGVETIGGAVPSLVDRAVGRAGARGAASVAHPG